MATVSDKPWADVSQADYSEEQWASACLIDKGASAGEGKQRYALPVREPGGALNRNAVHAAVGRVNQVDASSEVKATAAKKLVALYRSELSEDPPESLIKMAGMSMTSNRESAENQRGPIEFRESRLESVNYPNRIVTIIAVPYESPGLVEFRGQMYKEIFEREAFAGAEAIPNRVGCRRGHERGNPVGRVAQFPRGVSQDGLVADCRMAKTPLGDETLELANDECLFPSVGYAVIGDGQRIERRSMTRRITKAFLDHIAFVEQPAYPEARVLSVREDVAYSEPLPSGEVPNLDSTIAEMRDILEWSSARLKRTVD